MTRTVAVAAQRHSGVLIPVAVAAVCVSIAAQVAYPLAGPGVRDTVTVLVLAAAVVAMAADVLVTLGTRRGLVVVVGIPVLAFAAEWSGTHTGFPFGTYAYAGDRLPPYIAGVPVWISAAWLIGVWAVWRVAALVVPDRAVPRVALATVGLLGWDLYLDPQMVADGLWAWSSTDAGLPGMAQIPLTNFAGWALVGVVAMTVIELCRASPGAPDAPRTVPLVPMIWVVWTWVGSAFAQAFLLHDGTLRSGLGYGAVVMGVLAVPALVVAARPRRRAVRAGTMSA
ncbi:carotenoid biosynthesis protein [Williamsia deligens]|uniref:Carotenoid biosynthesis protein n=1 Tax=Williamsia deligens TaxID=321325 RepID=A0ABW3GA87_9NOCA|nr:carotenoid biosynthesis protein [Williamsia deligens]MCP2195856.1 putative membrane protein [Williamsia deligens]